MNIDVLHTQRCQISFIRNRLLLILGRSHLSVHYCHLLAAYNSTLHPSLRIHFFFLWTYFIYWCSKQCTITNNNKIQKEKEKKSRCFHFLLIIKSKKRQADTTLLIIMKKKASLKIQKKKKIKLRPVNLVFLYSGTFGKFFIAFFPYHIF